MQKVVEEGLEFIINEGVFYNPEMRLSRAISLEVLRELSKKHELKVLDAFSASGIRGVLYKKSSPNIRVDFLDYSEKAVKNIEENLKKHKIKGKIIRKEFNEFICNTKENYNFIELDPFGSSVEYLKPALKKLAENKLSWLSVTNTDLQVLCGVERRACLKFYQSYQKNNYFCHETGIRILLKKIATEASEENLVIKPLISFYYRHQFKCIVELRKDGKNAHKNYEKISYLKESELGGKFSKCGEIGPLWKENIAEIGLIKKILERLKKGKREGKLKGIEKKKIILLERLWEENEERFKDKIFYSIPHISKKLKINPPSLKEISEKIIRKGFGFARTHFTPDGFKTDANEEIIKEAFLRTKK